MDDLIFKKMFMGVFKYVGTEYPELKNEKNYSGIYLHECCICSREFFGYKHRRNCFDCQMIEDKIRCRK